MASLIINLYLPSAVFIAQVLVRLSKQLKQIFQIEHSIVKNPNWPEANQLAIYKRGRGFELGATEKQFQVVVRAGLEPGTAGLRVRRADHSATLPPPIYRGEIKRSRRMTNAFPTSKNRMLKHQTLN